MASNLNILSPSASSFLTAPSAVSVNSAGTSSPAEPNSPSLSLAGSNGIVTVDSERWTSSDYSDFTALSAVSSATPSILSINSSLPETNGVPTAPQSPTEAVNDNINTDNSTSIDTIRPESRWQDREKTPSGANTFSLLRYLSALPEPSGIAPGSFSPFEFPSLGQDASSATQQQQSAEQGPTSPFAHSPYSVYPPSTIPPSHPDPPMPSFSPSATVSTNLLDDSRQPSPAPSESVERLAADLMAFSMSSSSGEVPERHQLEGPQTSCSSTATSTLIPSPPTPTNAPTTNAPATAYEWTVATSPEPLPTSESADSVQGSLSGVNLNGTSIPQNATTASGGFSHSTTTRWPWMGTVDEHFPGHTLDAGRHDGAPLPHLMQVLPDRRPPVEFDPQQPVGEPPHLFGQAQFNAQVPTPPSTAVSPEVDGFGQGLSGDPLPPSYTFLPTAPVPVWPGPGPVNHGGDNANVPSAPITDRSSVLEQDWIQAYSVPTKPLYIPQETSYPEAPSYHLFSTHSEESRGPQSATAPFDFRPKVGDAEMTPRASGAGPDSWQAGSERSSWDMSGPLGSWGKSRVADDKYPDNGDLDLPQLPYRVPSPSSFRNTPTPQFPPTVPTQNHASFGCALFGPPSPSVNTESTETSSDSLYGLKPVAHQNVTNDQEFQAFQEVEPNENGKGRLAVNTEEARQAYEKAVQARKRFRGEVYPGLPPSSGLPDIDRPTAQKAYQDAVQARDRLVRRYDASRTHISQSHHEQPVDLNSPSRHSSVDFGPPFSPVQDLSYDLHSYFPMSAAPRLQTVSAPSHPTIVFEQYSTAPSPAASLEAIPIVPVSVPPVRRRETPGPERNDWKDIERPPLDEKDFVKQEASGRPQLDTTTAEEPGSYTEHKLHTGYPNYRSGSLHATPPTSPFIPPSRTSSASSMYVSISAPPLQCRPPPSPSSRSSSPATPRVLPRRRPRSIRRSTSTHTTPAVTFMLPGQTTTTQTGPSSSSAQGTSNPIHNFQSSYPGMSSGKLSTLNFNESTRPSPWISQVPTGNSSHWGTSSAPVHTFNGRSQPGFGQGLGAGAGVPNLNATPCDNQFGSSWPFAPLPNVTPTPAQWPFSGWPTGTPGQQQTPAGAWQQPSTNWGGSWFTHPGNTPPGTLFPPQAPMMSTAILPPSTSGPGTLARNTSLPFTQSTALPTYSLPTSQYPHGTQSQFMTPHNLGLPPHTSDPFAARAPPPYNTSPNGSWGNPGAHQVHASPHGLAGMSRYPPHSKYCFPDSNVAFVVQGIEYRVHRYFFEKHSSQMKEMLAAYPSALYHTEPFPLMLSGTDFDKLLSVLYPSNPLQSDLTEPEDFARVIRAAQQLGFQDICKSVIQMASKLSPVERILLSRNHDIKELAITAYEELCVSGKPVSAEDGEKLGATTVIKIWEIQQLLSAQEFCRSGCRKEFLETTVKGKFALE